MIWRLIHAMWFIIAVLLVWGAVLSAPASHATPSYCYSTGRWLPFPETQGYCPDSQSPFNGPGPSYGGGNHRWPDGSDD